MTFPTGKHERVELSIPGELIQLNSTQLFFLEAYLRKNMSGKLVLKGIKNISGKLILQLETRNNLAGMKSVMRKMIVYLLAFHFQNLGVESGDTNINIKTMKYPFGEVSPINVYETTFSYCAIKTIRP